MSFLPAINLDEWVKAIGYVGISAIIFAETGLFFCFFFPGDSLLFTAGLLAGRGIFKIDILIFLIVLMAILGYASGYWFGGRLGGWLKRRKDTWFYKKSYLEQAQKFYDKYGKKALLIGRFVPIVRTFIPVVGGIVQMPKKTYLLFNIIGAVLWGALVPLLGYFLGAVLPDANKYLMLVVGVIIILSILPGIIELLRVKFK